MTLSLAHIADEINGRRGPGAGRRPIAQTVCAVLTLIDWHAEADHVNDDDCSHCERTRCSCIR